MTEWTQAGQVPELSAYLLGGAQAPSTLPNGGFTNCQQQPQSPFGGQTPFAPQQPETAVCPKTWLVESILVTLFCCLPFGIVGIIKASQVESQFRIGNYAGAQQSSADAGKWTKLGFFIGLGVSLLYILLVLVGVVGSNL
ncbi:CD225/dispanin family protein [Paramuribaculum intestinale]|uniref:CD225/dispanin family protein n=4 Tax=Paramuribaculum intestinale TaxID=2094151 RepID=A0A2V1J3M4_9BACT|nr:CD225/dispanin family protein [Paramuribaculum intestinale]